VRDNPLLSENAGASTSVFVPFWNSQAYHADPEIHLKTNAPGPKLRALRYLPPVFARNE
jgi:hypothetical protein